MPRGSAAIPIDLLRLMMAEQEANQRPGRTPSALAFNEFAAAIPRTFEQDREAGVLSDMDARFSANREDQRKRQSAIDDEKAAATIRGFQTRRNISEVGDEPPVPFTKENFPAVSSRETVTPRKIQRIGSGSTPAATEARRIRKFTDTGGGFTDPDAAMSAREKAMIDPRVLVEQERSRGDLAAATASAAGKAPTGVPSAYAIETAQRTVSAIDEVMPNISQLTAGVGSLLSKVPNTKAADVSADLATVASNVAFNALQAMRDASKTGGALGQVSEKELDLLSSVQGSIRQNQSPENLRKNLQIIKESQQRFLDEAERLGAVSGTSRSAPAGKQRQVGRFLIEE